MDKPLLEDCRTIVRGSGASESKKTVAMNCVRALETNASDVAAILPMLLEVYFVPYEKAIQDAISKHMEACTNSLNGKKTWILTLLTHIGWPGAAVVIAYMIPDIVEALQKIL